MKSKFKKILENNRFMFRIVWGQSKPYFFVFFSAILIAYVNDILLVIAPKYILDSIQYGNGFNQTIFPILLYVVLYLIFHLLLQLLTYLKTMMVSKLKMNLNVKLGEKFTKVDYSFWKTTSQLTCLIVLKWRYQGGLMTFRCLV